METHAFGFRLLANAPEGQKRFPISRLLGVALMLKVVSGTAGNAVADRKDFVLTPLAFLEDPAPGGGTFSAVFESNVINNRGDVLFGSSFPQEAGAPAGDPFFPAAVFLRRKGVTSEIARSGDDGPGGRRLREARGSRPPSPSTRGAMWPSPFCSNRFPTPPFPPACPPVSIVSSSSAHTLSPVVIPGTPAPGGGSFAGASFGTSLNDRGDLVFAGILPTNQGLPFPEQQGLGQGLFRARRNGAIASVVSPGDAAPGGGVFDLAAVGFINNRGDVAFQGHVAGEECLAPDSPPSLLRHRLSW